MFTHNVLEQATELLVYMEHRKDTQWNRYCSKASGISTLFYTSLFSIHTLKFSAHTFRDEGNFSPQMNSRKYITEQIYVDRKFECDIQVPMMLNIRIPLFWGMTLCRMMDYQKH
jgi:hypothetical protein